MTVARSALLHHTTLAQKRIKLIRAKIGENLILPAHRRCLGLAGEALHLGEGGGVGVHIGAAVGDTSFLEVILGLIAPGATRLQVEKGTWR